MALVSSQEKSETFCGMDYFFPNLKNVVVLSLCASVLLVTYLAFVPPPSRPEITSLPELPNTVVIYRMVVDPWSHANALPPAYKKPGFHIPPSGEHTDESHITTGPPSEKSKSPATAALLHGPNSQSGSSPEMVPATPESRSKVILIWTKWFSKRIWNGLPEGTLSCAQYNINVSCRITYDKKEYEHSDLVAFHGRGTDFAVSNLPDLSKRLPHQRWVYYNRESPINSGLLNNAPQAKGFNGLFNWTMSYRLDSDIDYRYGRVVPGESPDEYNTEHGEKAVAVIGHCMQQRMKYITELQKHMQVHVYGHCGTYKCASGEACFDMLKGKYKFYLSFENSVCKDYVTEKFYLNALQHNMLPIVINGGNFSDPSVAPPGCCIKASDFKGARELAEYIRMVDRNSTLYNNYFKWHSRYTVQEVEPRTKVFCRACHKLYTDFEAKVYHNLHSWYGIEENCVPYPTP